MKHYLIFVFLILGGFIFSDAHANGGHYATSATLSKSQTVKKQKAGAYQHYRKIWEQQLGRKLRFSEKLGLRMLLLTGEPDPLTVRRANSNALLGFIFGVSSFVVFGLLAIPGLILSNQALNEERRYPGILQGDRFGLARAGKIISIVYLSLLALALVIILAYIGAGLLFL
jgi:hypothetical protein